MPHAPFKEFAFKPTSALSASDIERARKILEGRQPFTIYFNSALADLQADRTHDNRWFYFSEDHGLVMGIDFEGMRVVTVLGDVETAVLQQLRKYPKRTEYHVTESYATQLKHITEGGRLVRENRLRYYQLNRSKPFEISAQVLVAPELGAQSLVTRRLTTSDLMEVSEFYARHYSETIFSAWMLEQPFIVVMIDGELAAAGGAVVLDHADGACNIGNFLTSPAHRRRGLGKAVAQSLINELIAEGFYEFTLGTTEQNVAACKTYESIGFRLIEQRMELEFAES